MLGITALLKATSSALLLRVPIVMLLWTGSAAPAPHGGPSPADADGLKPCSIRLAPGTRGAHTSNLWPGGIVPYEFDANVDSTNRQRVLDAMAEIESVSGVSFVPRTNEPDYIHILASNGNWSYVGMIGGRQDLGIFNWSVHYIIVHELMHALGAWHEQQRPDRDQFVSIEWNNIQAGQEHNFQIPNGATAFGAYDFDSIMHYGACAFSVCAPCSPFDSNCRTITVLPPNDGWQDQIGQLDHLSAGDAALLAGLYPEQCGSDPALGAVLEASVIGSDTLPRDGFGGSVAIEGDVVVVGAQNAGNTNGGSDGAGAAYVFEFDGATWTQTARLIPSDLHTDDEFGNWVAISVNTIAVGAHQHDHAASDAGAVYVFDKPAGGWTDMAETVEIVASDAAPRDSFGLSIALEGNRLIVGAPNDDDCGSRSGSAYVFERSGNQWLEVAKIVPATDCGAGDRFGISVAVQGDTVVVGADQASTASGGKAYVFQLQAGNWVQVAKLTASDPTPDARFGFTVAIEGDTIAIGARFDDEAAANAGAVYVFERPVGGWQDATENAKLLTCAASDSDFLGVVDLLDGAGIIIAGAYASSSTGFANLYRRPFGGWSDAFEGMRLVPEDATGGDQFGVSVAADQFRFVVGAAHGHDYVNPGVVYVYRWRTCPGDLNFDGRVSLMDLAIILDNFGIPSGATPEMGDIDRDGDVDLSDLSVLLSNYGTICEG